MGLRQTAAVFFTLLAVGVHAGPFTPGNLVVYRVGGVPPGGVPPAPTLVGTGNVVLLDEYTTSGVLVQSVALPTVLNGAQRPLVASGTATSDGLLTRSADGTCLAVTGYGRDLSAASIAGGNLTSGTIGVGGPAVPRVVARVLANGLVDSSTALGDAATGTNFRGAASVDCSGFWVSGNAGGVRYAALGATSSADLTNAAPTSLASTRAVAIFGGQLYASSSVGALTGVAAIGTGTPTAGTQPLSKLPGSTTPSTYSFFLADLDASVPGFDTLYVADDDAAGGGLTKFSLNNGTWTSKGTVGAPADAYRGLTGVVTETGTVILYATRKGGSGTAGGGELVTLSDPSGYNGAFIGSPTVLATAANRNAFRGVALAPGLVTITPSAGPNGSISPATPQLVPGAVTRTFTVTASAGYTATVGGTCGGALVGTTYTTPPATTSCTVIATFAQITHTVTPSAGANGTITPSSPQVVPHGGTTTFNVAAATGYSASVGGSCGGTLSGNTYTTAAVNADCTVVASFTLVTHTVTPSAGANGTISPNSAQGVPEGSTATFTVSAAFGYSPSVSGSCGGTLSGNTYTTNPVTGDCTVAATFAPLPNFVVTPVASANGTVTPNTPQSVMSGQTVSFTVVPAPQYSVAIRGTCGGNLAGGIFTTAPVTGDCTVIVSFARKVVLFVGNSYTFGRVDPVMSYNAANVSDLTAEMWRLDPTGTNDDEPHPWGGIPGVFKKLTDQASLEYDVSISARNAASLRGHYLNTNTADWDLRDNIASQRWDAVVLQDLSDEPLPAGFGANANLTLFNVYADRIQSWIQAGAAESFHESDVFAGGSGALRVIAPANANANPQAKVYLYETWARPDMIGPNGTNGPDATHPQYYRFGTQVEGLKKMTCDLQTAYFGRARANPRFEGVSPVGDAFLLAVQRGIATADPYTPEAGKMNLWHTDFFHPSKYGSYLSALVHFARITGLDPAAFGEGEQAAIALGIAPADAVQLQRIARDAATLDTTKPVTAATVSTPPNGQGWNSGSVTVTLAAASNAGGCKVSSIGYTLSGAQSGSGSIATGGTVAITAEGETTLTYFATDDAGNAESARTLVVRIDSTPPSLSVPADFTVDATGPAGTGVTYNVTAADNSGLAPSVACVPPSGSTLAIGSNPVSCTATDAAGNSASAGFNVTVRAFTLTPSAGAHGSIDPNVPQVVVPGSTRGFTVHADAGYRPVVAGTCGGTLSGDVFTTDPAVADCTVTAAFVLITFAVTPGAAANGTITPSGVQTVPQGSIATFTVVPAAGFSASVGGSCGGVLNGTTYTTNAVSADCTVTPVFTQVIRYTVTPAASAHGAISPGDSQSVIAGQSASFTITPAAGYSAAIRGTCGGTLTSNTFTTHAVNADCTVQVTFAQKLVLFVGDGFTFGHADPVMTYNAANVSDLTQGMAATPGTNEVHPWGGIPGVFKKMTGQVGLDYDVSISARAGATLRTHYLNPDPPAWDLRADIASQKWNVVVLQDSSDEPLPAGRSANANLPSFDTYVDRIEAWIHQGTATPEAPANPGANPQAEVFLYQTWARPDMIGPNGTFYVFDTQAKGLKAMTDDLHAAYFNRATANTRIEDVSAVGDAFLLAVQLGIATSDPYVPQAGKINLWDTDFFNPSKYGSYLSALVHFATITGIDPMTLGAGEQAAVDLGIDSAVAVQLQRVARATVMPDVTPPTSSATAAPPANAAGWNRSSVTVTFAAADNPGGWGMGTVAYTLSGAQTGTGSVPSGGNVTITREGTTTLTYFATDAAGNAENAHALVIRIDSTPPTLGVPSGLAVDATSPSGALVTYSVTTADNSGLAPSLACVPPSGSTLHIGTNALSCTATDAAGNSTIAGFTVSVRGTAEQSARLIAAVLALKGINVSPAVTTLLTSLLQSALNSGNGTLFCAGLTAFAKQVALLSGHGIPAVQATQLVASANQIKNVQGCH